ncbi:hypothetical protein CMT41_15490 [Colwellia sp. MT41]|uniref:acyltransferase family protein n=1 Tax=Colwellia sp. MT41 TaxID=58049 RepID=UPI000717563B|nr:acyltransferase family protein [Colwellia sp. MT41]ALO35970.1 hypothetical protein CMT41_15490 [Colwellia sp. MT41]
MFASNKKNKLDFRPDLQGLRAISIALVVLGHAGFSFMPGGFVGVDVFFVLSGFLITSLLVKEINSTGSIDFMRFYARRFKRLLPALAVMLVGSFAVGLSVLSVWEVKSQLASSSYAALWLSNIYFAFSQVDYFNELAKHDLFIHTWTLGVEEQFYFLWPLLLLIIFKFSQKNVTDEQATAQTIFIGISLLFFTSLALSLYWSMQAPKLAFYLMPTRIWQFALGGIIYLKFTAIKKRNGHINIVVNYALLALGLCFIVISALLLTADNVYPGVWALIPTAGAALVIVSGHRLQHKSNLLSHPVLVWLGDRSYSLYLWHWPIFAIGFSLGFKDQLFPIMFMILLSILMAILSYRLIELPFWRGRWSGVKAARIILLSILVMLATSFVFNNKLSSLPEHNINKALSFPKHNMNKALSQQWRADLPIIYRMPCDAWYANSEVQPCVFGDESAAKTVVLLGDSIGAQWFSVLPELFPTPEWRIIVYTKSSCPIVDEDYFYQRIKKIYQVCSDWRAKVITRLKIIKPDIIIMGSGANKYFTAEQWITGSEKIFKSLSQVSRNVFVIPGTPSLGFDGPSCVTRNLSPDGRVNLDGCKVANRLKHVDLVSNYLHRAASLFENVNVIDLNDLVCPDGVCNAISENGVVVFRDSQHLTDSFVKQQIPEIKKRLNKYLMKNE